MAKRIVIIGAGAAGLMAASKLADTHEVVVVEARNRTGGRIHTLENVFSKSVDAGAEFVHGKLPQTMDLLKKAGRVTKKLSGEMYECYDGKISKGEGFDHDLEAVKDKLRTLKEDIDIASFLEKHFKEKRYDDLKASIKGFVEGFDAADMTRVSALSLKKEWEQSNDEEQFHIDGNGYAEIVRLLEEKVKKSGVSIKLSSVVKHIHWQDSKLKISLETGEDIYADKILITVPLGILRNRSIVFDPALPEHDQAVQKMGFGGVIKFMFEFRGVFWRDKINELYPDASFIFSDAEIPTWWTQNPDKIPLLTGWLAGPRSSSVGHDPTILFGKALGSLSKILKTSYENIQENIVQSYIADWVNDPFSLGAYSYQTVDTGKAQPIFATPVDNKLYFAGEAFYSGPAVGTVEAALESAARTAEKILAD